MWREPDVVIGGRDNPYLLRWHLIPRNKLFGIYLHRFLRDDDDRALHDHPKNNISFILTTGYRECLFSTEPLSDAPLPSTIIKNRRPLVPYFRKGTTAHRVILYEDSHGHKKPVWSLFLTGPMFRDWGFWCPAGRWVHWKKFQGGGTYEATNGPGCS